MKTTRVTVTRNGKLRATILPEIIMRCFQVLQNHRFLIIFLFFSFFLFFCKIADRKKREKKYKRTSTEKISLQFVKCTGQREGTFNRKNQGKRGRGFFDVAIYYLHSNLMIALSKTHQRFTQGFDYSIAQIVAKVITRRFDYISITNTISCSGQVLRIYLYFIIIRNANEQDRTILDY